MAEVGWGVPFNMPAISPEDLHRQDRKAMEHAHSLLPKKTSELKGYLSNTREQLIANTMCQPGYTWP